MKRRLPGAVAALVLALGMTLGLTSVAFAQDGANGAILAGSQTSAQSSAIGDTSADSTIGETSGTSTIDADQGNANPQGMSNSTNQGQSPATASAALVALLVGILESLLG